MIQRLQSIFLLFASGSCFGLFGTDAADSDVTLDNSILFSDASYNVFDDPVLMGIFGLAGVVFLADIFLFRNRPLQMKLSMLAVALTVTGVAYGAFLYFTDTAAEISAAVTPDVGLALPVITLIFGILARNYIQKDEKLVRSADRLR
jgi:hypothetical protein